MDFNRKLWKHLTVPDEIRACRNLKSLPPVSNPETAYDVVEKLGKQVTLLTLEHGALEVWRRPSELASFLSKQGT